MHNWALKTPLYSNFALPWRCDIIEYSSIVNKLKIPCADLVCIVVALDLKTCDQMVPLFFVSKTLPKSNVRADWCKNTAVCDENTIFGMIVCHAITNNFDTGPSNIGYIKVARGDFILDF